MSNTQTASTAAAAIVETWETHEGTVTGYGFEGDALVEVAPLQNAAQAAKWGERYTSGRDWAAYRVDGSIVTGHSANLRAAKRDALVALSVTS